ncbi:MAG TPA: hypothetical protein PKE69_19295 [Pyrinomonadaceae bacterium]|nr:hypothetical protein [Pyrinomonadaceae bacterium]
MSYRKTSEIEEKLKRFETVEESTDFDRIRCPLCLWQPLKSSQWFCADCDAPEFFYGGCGNMWNTFETRGKCPTCAHLWRWTSCLQCGEWSRHEDWYKQNDETMRR